MYGHVYIIVEYTNKKQVLCTHNVKLLFDSRPEFTFFVEPRNHHGGEYENQILYSFKTYLNKCDNIKN